MPFGNFYLPAPERLARETKQEQCIDSSLPIFPSDTVEEDSLDMVVDEWDGWLKWDGTIEVVPSFESRRQSTASSFYESESSMRNMIKNPESIFCDGIAEDDAPFELEEPTTSPQFPFPPLSFPYSDDSRSIKLRDQPMGNPGRPLHAYSTLSATEEQRLRDIAMPEYVLERAASTDEQDDSVPKAVKARGRPRGLKRKSSMTKADQLDMCQYRKQSHNTIEKRYRINLNDKIDILRRSIPKFHDTPSRMTDGDEAEPGSPSAYKSGKASVLTGAVEYILQLESSTKRLATETAALKARLAAFEKLALAGSIFSGVSLGPDTPVSDILEGLEPITPSKARSIDTDTSHGRRKKQVAGP